MDKTKLKEYEDLETLIRVMEEKKARLRGEILSTLQQENLLKAEGFKGSFIVGHKTAWKYSPAIVKLEESLKIKRLKEQEKGVAKPLVSNFLIYREITDKGIELLNDVRNQNEN